MRLVLALITMVAALTAEPALAQSSAGSGARPSPASPPTSPSASRPQQAATPHPAGELDCRNCHRGEHQGIVQMYIGMGGRGTSTIPSHMFQVRVQCIACHTTPSTPEGSGGLSGQTFKPSEQACVGCHGEKYRGMLQQWTTTLTRMAGLVTPKLRATRATLSERDRGDPKVARARALVDDAEFNVKFVVVAKGIHNVFYAADLLKLANGWLDDANALLGGPTIRADDQLVRGGYCAVLCHQAAGVKAKETVTFAGRKLPHVRHVAEFGATCTSCHSAETHKRVTASAATCASCHHSPQNERCETCHRAQSAFYSGEAKSREVTITPNTMAAAVACTGCHDFTRKPSRAAVAETCQGCHDTSYMPLFTEWTTGFDRDLKATVAALADAERVLTAARRAGRANPDAEALLKQGREAHALVKAGGVAHNPLAADALLAAARRKAAEARTHLGR
jgi:hypothetical protein